VANPKSAMRPWIAYGIGLAAFLTVLLWVSGVPLTTSLLLTLLVAWQSLGGLLIWRAIRPQSTHLEMLGMGLSIGTAMAATAGLITASVGVGPWGSLVPSAVAVSIAIIRRTTTAETSTFGNRWEVSSFLATVFVGTAVFLYALRSYPLTWTESWLGYHPDMAFFEALANSLARFGAFESPFMSDGVVYYHWLSYAWAGQLSVISGAAPFVGITRVLPLIALLGSAAIVIAWTRRLSTSSWTPFLAGALLTISGFVGAVFGGVLTLDSPSQAMSVLWLLGFTVAVIQLFEKAITPGTLAIVALLAVAITLGKVSAAAPALAGVLLAALVLTLRKSLTPSRGLTIALITAVPIAAAFLLFLAGATGGGGLTIGSLLDKSASQQGLNPLDGPRGVLIGTVILILAITPRWAGIFQLLLEKAWRWRPETWISVGMIASSIGALIAFNSFNELWFSVSASGPLAVTSAVGVGLAAKSISAQSKLSTRQLLTTATIAAAIIFFAVSLLWSTGASGGNTFVSTLRWLGPIIAWVAALALGVLLALSTKRTLRPALIISGMAIVLVFTAIPGRLLGTGSDQIGVLNNGTRNEWFDVINEDNPAAIDIVNTDDWTGQKMQAAARLRELAQPQDILITNLTLDAFVPGVSHLPTYVSAITYQYDYGPSWVRDELLARESQVWDFINAPTQSTAIFLCDSDARWLWIDKDRTDNVSWEPFASSVFENEEVILAEVNPSQCR